MNIITERMMQNYAGTDGKSINEYYDLLHGLNEETNALEKILNKPRSEETPHLLERIRKALAKEELPGYIIDDDECLYYYLKYCESHID